MLARVLLLILSFATAQIARADLVDALNDVRQRGCGRLDGVKGKLETSRQFDQIAREWSRGGRLSAAIERSGQRISNSASMHVEGARSEDALLEVLTDNYCESIVDERFTHIGSYTQGSHVWIVVGTPFAALAPADRDTVRRRTLQLVNEARAKQRRCGKETFQAAPPLKSAALLEQAALAHAKDMAAHNLFEHVGSDGSRPADRVTRTGYRWRAVAENIAAGSADVDRVVNGWLESPGHCRNIMGAQYTEMGIAYVVDPKSEDGIYWAQVFGTPR
jgi:uncharacterized protein YkwD